MDEENNLNLPFQALLDLTFPQQAQGEKENENDRELFLRNLAKLEGQKPAPPKQPGFTLADLGVSLNKAPQAKMHEPAPSARKGRKIKKEYFAKAQPKPEACAKPGNQPANDETGLRSKQEDSNAFLAAVQNVAPLKPGGRMIKPARNSRDASQAEAGFESLLADNLEFALLNADEYVEGYVSSLDESIINRLRQGQFGPEAHLDLHGLNSMQAFEAVRDFIRESWFKGMRTVLLVPGRGLNSPDGRGILRQKLREWLVHEPFKRVVLAFCTAQPRDGGLGSLYVLLRNNRKKGRVYWERMPPDPDLYEN